jgi:hypothetical protein
MSEQEAALSNSQATSLDEQGGEDEDELGGEEAAPFNSQATSLGEQGEEDEVSPGC